MKILLILVLICATRVGLVSAESVPPPVPGCEDDPRLFLPTDGTGLCYVGVVERVIVHDYQEAGGNYSRCGLVELLVERTVLGPQVDRQRLINHNVIWEEDGQPRGIIVGGGFLLKPGDRVLVLGKLFNADPSKTGQATMAGLPFVFEVRYFENDLEDLSQPGFSNREFTQRKGSVPSLEEMILHVEEKQKAILSSLEEERQ